MNCVTRGSASTTGEYIYPTRIFKDDGKVDIKISAEKHLTDWTSSKL